MRIYSAVSEDIKINVEKLNELLWWVTDHPEQHRQEIWVRYGDDGPFSSPEEAAKHGRWDCGTTACLAGWSALLSGWTPVIREFNDPDLPAAVTHYCLHPYRVEKSGELPVPVWIAAARELGLNLQQSDALFSADAPLYKLWRFAAEWSDNRIQVPEHLFVQDPESTRPEDRVLASTLPHGGAQTDGE